MDYIPGTVLRVLTDVLVYCNPNIPGEIASTFYRKRAWLPKVPTLIGSRSRCVPSSAHHCSLSTENIARDNSSESICVMDTWMSPDPKACALTSTREMKLEKVLSNGEVYTWRGRRQCVWEVVALRVRWGIPFRLCLLLTLWPCQECQLASVWG